MTGKRIYGLDILRAIAILTVVVAHSSMMLPASISQYFYRYMIDGVSIFFVLSGFLIGTILLKKINNTSFDLGHLFDFWVRRWLRTLPAFFTVLIILILFYYHHQTLPSKNIILQGFTFSQSLLFGKTTFYFESWSLAVEEWFYLLIPLLLFFGFIIFRSNRKKTFLIVILSIIVLSTIARIYRTSQINYSDLPTWDFALRRPVFMRLDSIMYGVLGSYVYYYKFKIWQHKNLFFAIGLSMYVGMEIIGTLGSFEISSYLNLTLESIATLCLLPKLNSINSGKGIFFKMITFISVISYSLYLLNATPFYEIVFPYFQKYIGANYFVEFIAYYVVVFLGSFLLYRIIEKPFMDMREKFSKKGISHVSCFHITPLFFRNEKSAFFR